MKKTIGLLALFSAAFLTAADGVWSKQGSAVIDPRGVNQAGNLCITAVGDGSSKGYGGLILTMPLDLTGATGTDTIRFSTYHNIYAVTVLLRSKSGNAYRSIRLPDDGSEVVLKLDPAEWKFTNSKHNGFVVYDDLVFFQSELKMPDQSLGITGLSIEKDGKKLYEYKSDMTLKPRKNQVYNLGRGGHNSYELRNYMLSRALKLQPTTAIVMIGTNDVNNPGKLIPLDQYENNLRHIIAEFEKSGAKLILITPPPCIDSILYKRSPQAKIGNASENIRNIVSIVRKVAAEKNCILVDFYQIVSRKAPLESPESYLRNPANSAAEDGVHPTRSGYTALSQAVYDAIVKNNCPTARVVCVGDSITYGSAMLGAGSAYGYSYPAQLAELLNK